MALDYPNYQVIVIDNASSDDSCEVISIGFPSVKLIRKDTNLGVTRGRNVGIDYALSNSADYILFLDNDTVIHKTMLTELVSVAEQDDRIAIVTSKIYFYSDRNKIWALGGGVNFYTGHIDLKGYGEMDHGQYDSDSAIEVDHVTGCCLLVKSDVIRRVGRFDTRFYSGQDTELCTRARAFGYKIIAVPEAVMWHKDSHTWAKKDIHQMRSKSIILLMHKYARIYHWIIFLTYSFFGLATIIIRQGIGPGLKNISSKFKGAVDTLKE